MKHFLLISCLSFFLFSCEDEEAPTPESGTLSKVVGDRIYKLLQGDSQKGAPGQHLAKSFKLIVTDYKGNIVNEYLEFELTDESGLITHTNNYYPTDTIIFKWKLGCEATTQILKIKNPHVCGVAKTGCIPVDIFEVTASATEEISSGWYTPCSIPSEHNYYSKFHVNDQRLIMISYDEIVSTTDLISSDWINVEPSFDFSDGKIDMLSSGELFFSGYGNDALSSADGAAWKYINLPSSYYYDEVDMEVTKNGSYFLAVEGDSFLYGSSDGVSWDTYLNLYELTNGNSYSVQALAVDNNKLYVVMTAYYVIEIDATNNESVVHHISDGSWSYYGDLNSFEVAALNNEIFLKNTGGYYYDETIHVLNLDSNTEEVYDITYGNKLIKSEGDIFLIKNLQNVEVWSGSDFVAKNYPSPSDDQSEFFGIYKGAPIAISDHGNILYYIN